MPPLLAFAIWFVLLILLFRYDPAKNGNESWALWVPVTWMFIVASRLPSQWVGTQIGSAAAAFEEGNSLDRVIWLGLILAAIAILTSRSFQWGDFFSRNAALVAYLCFALLSVLWSDSSFVSFKRWFRDLGSYFTILIVLSDPNPFDALRTVLRRLCYLLIPLSVVLIKYTNIGRVYDQWSGKASYIGATTSKNMLGALCLVAGIFFFWDTLIRWPERKEGLTKRIFFVTFVFAFLTAYLLYRAHSATSAVCFVLGCAVLAAAHSNWGERHPTFLKAIIPISFCVYLLLGFGFGLNGTFAEMLGRDPTLTDRTKIWSALLSMDTNPMIGTGYESFWLGPRLDLLSLKLHEHINEAHDGYLEVYLNLGLIGLSLLCVILVVAYRNICKKDLTGKGNFTSLSLAMWSVVLFYNITEASFKHGVIWLALLLGAISLRERQKDLVISEAAYDPDQVREQESLDVEYYSEWSPTSDMTSRDDVLLSEEGRLSIAELLCGDSRTGK
jgi:exopolysaccharide production protein ExoQ